MSRSDRSIRNFCLVIYPDAENYDCYYVLDAVKWYFSEWAYVLHDKDVDENGELKKPHYHVACRKSSPSTIKTVSNQLKVPENYIESISSWNNYLQYMLHWNDPSKYQYDDDALHTNLPLKLFKSPDATSFAAYKAMTDQIYNGGCRSLTELSNFAVENGYWSEFRRNWSLMRALLDEASAKRAAQVVEENPFLHNFII